LRSWLKAAIGAVDIGAWCVAPSVRRTVTEPSGSVGTGTPIPTEGAALVEAIIVLALTLLVALLVIDRQTRE
jgi:hypothetical protein